MLATRPTPEKAIGARDRAMLLLGFGTALRRSELAGLCLGNVTDRARARAGAPLEDRPAGQGTGDRGLRQPA